MSSVLLRKSGPGWRAFLARPPLRVRTAVLISRPRRPCATPRSGCASCGARPGSACTKSTGSRGGATGRPSCARSCACRPISTSTPTPICSSRSSRRDMRTRFRDKLQASLAPESGGDYEDEHRITRFDGTTGWILLRGKTFFQEAPSGKAADTLDRPDRRHHGSQARRGGQCAACLDGALIDGRDLLDRS